MTSVLARSPYHAWPRAKHVAVRPSGVLNKNIIITHTVIFPQFFSKKIKAVPLWLIIRKMMIFHWRSALQTRFQGPLSSFTTFSREEEREPGDRGCMLLRNVSVRSQRSIYFTSTFGWRPVITEVWFAVLLPRADKWLSPPSKKYVSNC